jgi:Thioesterase-like superfamily
VQEDSGISDGPPGAFLALEDGGYQATELTRGPWHPEHQHAGPPSALVAQAIARTAAPLGFTHIARLTVSLYRPIPIAQLKIVVETGYSGRNIGHFSARLIAAGKDVAHFSALAQREAILNIPPDLPGHPPPVAPRTVEESPLSRFPFANRSLGYADLMETRLAQGSFFSGPAAVWFRLRRPLIAGQEPSGIERVAVAADSANGISAVLEFKRYVFLNNDLCINLFRKPEGEWVCIDARTLIGPDGGGLAEAQIFDRIGLIGRSTQSLMIRLRE